MIQHFYDFLGEHIRNWRPRYFILKDNGQFIGFKKEPTSDVDLVDPLNNFTVKNCQILPSDRPKPFTFIVRGLQMTTVVERMFCVNNEEERKVMNPILFTFSAFSSQKLVDFILIGWLTSNNVLV